MKLSVHQNCGQNSDRWLNLFKQQKQNWLKDVVNGRLHGFLLKANWTKYREKNCNLRKICKRFELFTFLSSSHKYSGEKIQFVVKVFTFLSDLVCLKTQEQKSEVCRNSFNYSPQWQPRKRKGPFLQGGVVFLFCNFDHHSFCLFNLNCFKIYFYW